MGHYAGVADDEKERLVPSFIECDPEIHKGPGINDCLTLSNYYRYPIIPRLMLCKEFSSESGSYFNF